MGLRTANVAAGQKAERRSPAQWRALVEQTVADGAAAARLGDVAELAAVFARLGEWEDAQRAYQARNQLAELVFQVGASGTIASWAGLYLAAAEALVVSLEREPAEPVVLNALGVALYELLELPGAKGCFESALRLDPDIPHARANIDEVARREQARLPMQLPKGLATRARVLGSRARKVADRARPTAGMTLSLCMIVKDEEEMLPGCLEAIAPAVDEIVIVDTGSTDRTVEIAGSFGAKVVSFPWNGSFSDARNASLGAATSDWIVYLDADEHVEPEDAPLLRDLLGRTWREGFHLVETNYTGGDESGHAVTHTALRVFRNRPEYRFEGRIHEQKTHTMPTFLPERFESTRIRVRHYGYLKGRLVSKDKSRRNIELLEQERREARSPFNSFNLGSEYMALGDWPAARRYLDEAWDAARALAGWEGIPYVPLLVSRVARARREAGETADARAAIDEGLAVFPDHTDLVFEQALCAREDGDLAAAAALARRCLEMGDAPSHYAATVGSGSHLAQILVAELHAAEGRTADAEAAYLEALEQHPEFVAPVLHLAGLMLRRGAEDAEVAAAMPAGRPSAQLLLATAFHEAGRHEAAEERFRAVLARQPANGVARVGLVESLLSQRRYTDAREEAALEPEDSPVRQLALLSSLFAAAVQSDLGGLAGLIERARAEEMPHHALDAYAAWRAALAGSPPTPLQAESSGLLATALEALLRVQEFEAFDLVHSLLCQAMSDVRERQELLAQIYLRRGYLESAADEWIAACDTAPDVRAFVGLAQVALARELAEDALAFAEAALELDSRSVAASRLAEAARRQTVSEAAAPAA